MAELNQSGMPSLRVMTTNTFSIIPMIVGNSGKSVKLPIPVEQPPKQVIYFHHAAWNGGQKAMNQFTASARFDWIQGSWMPWYITGQQPVLLIKGSSVCCCPTQGLNLQKSDQRHASCLQGTHRM